MAPNISRKNLNKSSRKVMTAEECRAYAMAHGLVWEGGNRFRLMVKTIRANIEESIREVVVEELNKLAA